MSNATLGRDIVRKENGVVSHGEPVFHWNDVLLDVIRQVGGPPTPIFRGSAMMHGAVYDAVNSIHPTHEPYLVRVPPGHPNTSVEAAIAHAAHDTLAAAFPDTRIDLARELASALEALPPGTSPEEVSAGEAVGEAAARAMIDARSCDGADDDSPYVNGTEPGDWRPTGSGPAASPNWPRVKPFFLASGSQFRPPPPGGFPSRTQILRSTEYAAQLNEVKRLGRASSMARSPEQTEIAFFWANDLDGTDKPPGQLFEITKIVSAQRHLDTVRNARLFGLVALTMADGAIAAWDAKYANAIDLWWAETAIRLANRDGNPLTTRSVNWKPLSINSETGARFSPPFPAYISGHATFGAAHAAVMRLYFDTDNVTFTATSEDPNLEDGVTRTFNSFTQAALENGRSRIYLGVHFQWDADHGFVTAAALAEHLYATRLRPVAN